jgi:hypothetical protein
MNRLYQWLTERASFFRSDRSDQGMSRTVRTEVTVQQERMTLMVDGAAAGFDICPLCGNNLAPAQTEKAIARLQQGSLSQELSRPGESGGGGV